MELSVWHLIIGNVASVVAILIPILTYYSKQIRWREAIDRLQASQDEKIEENKSRIKEIEIERGEDREKVYNRLNNIDKTLSAIDAKMGIMVNGPSKRSGHV